MRKIIEENNIRRLFGKNLKRLRSLQNLSQMGLSDRADLTHTFINDIERGKKWVSIETLAKLSAALQTEPYQFFLPDSVPQEHANNFFRIYIDDFSKNVQKVVGEFTTHYLKDLDDES